MTIDHSRELEERLACMGAIVDQPLLPSAGIYRFRHVDDRVQSKTIWAHVFIDMGAVYGNWKTGEKYHYQPGNRLTRTERRSAAIQARKQKRIREAELRERWKGAAINGFNLWNTAGPANPEHAHLKHKQVPPLNLRQSNSALLLPGVDFEGHLWTVEFIYPDGKKMLLKGARKKGCFHVLPGIDDKVFLCEGFSTAASVHLATGNTCVIAFDCGNLVHVAGVLRYKYQIITAADNDLGKPINAGLEAAKHVEAAHGIPYVLPDMGGEKCDWNDIHVNCGLREVKSQIMEGLSS